MVLWLRPALSWCVFSSSAFSRLLSCLPDADGALAVSRFQLLDLNDGGASATSYSHRTLMMGKIMRSGRIERTMRPEETTFYSKL
ncbi:uncharacterized protein F5891DRAFT_1004721 [Suillus fuscotomentosus]|uniref:Secreted protein n=1 Tax=Suillus fuscotomentosus TaxID=1912939 RepID=A0AAD4HSV4_9AGAM|nr:uncharacterized protein F5891DRAFT_1004721 [Suillus fuscotomentosus]KAG1906254.1 hypothetical protein F5891DRAFT_1004721 [Suillus fuscotomentosus]